MSSYVIGVDVGGTCTDCAVLGPAGEIVAAKAFSTPPDFSRGILDAVGIAAETLGLSPTELLAAARLFLHSTTVAENAVVDGRLCKAGLLVTRGFEETLFMTRGGYGRWFGLTEEGRKNVIDTDKPKTLVPLTMIEGIAERIDARGKVLAAASRQEVAAAVRALVDRGAAAVGVCFLWSFRNPENERLVEGVVRELYPDLFFCRSSRLAPIEGEYERVSTVALNVCLGPLVERYLLRLRSRLEETAFQGDVLVMQSHGGLLGIDEAPDRAVGMIESGPVGGLVGCKAIGEELGWHDLLVADMGGTTFKVGAVRKGRIDYEREPAALRYHYSLHKMEIVSIALAGGSVVWLDERSGAPRIGPRSAGSTPGPVCYGLGGAEPTVTDVDLLLGYLDPRFFLAGRASLRREEARRGFARRIAQPLGMETAQAAAAIYELANSIIYDLLHRQTVEKGLDPRRYTLFSCGGTAGMHLGAVAPQLGVRRIVVPPSASIQGAFGLISADLAHTESATLALPVPADPSVVNEVFAGLERDVVEQIVAGGARRDEVSTDRSIDMRYRKQVHVVNTPVPHGGILARRDLERICELFEELYAERYGPEAGHREAGMEMVSFLVRGVAAVPKPELRPRELAGEDPAAALVETRDVYFGSCGETRQAYCYDFDRLSPGNAIRGPAIVWSPHTTIVIEPAQTARLDRFRNLVITW